MLKKLKMANEFQTITSYLTFPPSYQPSKYDFDLSSDGWKQKFPNYEKLENATQPSDPLITVVIPNFNKAKYLGKSLESVKNQTIGLAELQIIIIDDDSSDNSKNIITDFIINTKNSTAYFFDKNSGAPGIPRNFGITKTSGNYVIFLDSDDWLTPNALEILYRTINGNDDDISLGKTIKVTDNEEKPAYLQHSDIAFSNKPIDEMRRMWWGGWAPASKLLKTSIIKNNNLHFPNLDKGEDIKFFYDYLTFSQTAAQTTELITWMNRKSDNQGQINRKQRFKFDHYDQDFLVIRYIENNLTRKFSRRFLTRRVELTCFGWFMNTKSITKTTYSYKLRLRQVKNILKRGNVDYQKFVVESRVAIARKLLN